MCLCNKNYYYNCQFRQNRKRAKFLKSHTTLKLVFMFKCFKSGILKQLIKITSHTGEAGLRTLYNYIKFCHSDLANVKYLPRRKTDS